MASVLPRWAIQHVRVNPAGRSTPVRSRSGEPRAPESFSRPAWGGWGGCSQSFLSLSTISVATTDNPP